MLFNEYKVYNKSRERRTIILTKNYCTCCGNPHTEGYGSVSISDEGVEMDCTREVCVLCLEGACKCAGNQLKEKGYEYHKGCVHDK